LDAAVNGELGSLKLEKAEFRSSIESLAPENWSPAGAERVEFQVSTNPGAPLGPLSRIASGGELSRFLLALKVVLAAEGEAASLVFDEIDRGIGGAVADAVGERLARLAKQTQVLVVTHSPQVAAQANHHWRINKGGTESNGDDEGGVLTQVERLDSGARREEIARMLSGATVTDEARAAADRLLDVDAA
jgi:DNA repair protein RecN (Recombination protein N)